MVFSLSLFLPIFKFTLVELTLGAMLLSLSLRNSPQNETCVSPVVGQVQICYKRCFLLLLILLRLLLLQNLLISGLSSVALKRLKDIISPELHYWSEKSLTFLIKFR